MDEGQILALRHGFTTTLTGGGQPVLQPVAVSDQGGLGGHRETAVRMIVAVLVGLPRVVDQSGKDHDRQRHQIMVACQRQRLLGHLEAVAEIAVESVVVVLQ